MEHLTDPQRAMLRMLSHYDRRGAADPIHYDTRSTGDKVVLRNLARMGLAQVWHDAEDPARWWAALPEETQ